jgi:serine/threonine protein kinase
MGACPQLEEPRTIGKHPLLEKIGEGCLGPVYRSFDRELGRAIAVRILCDGIKWDPQLEELFRNECQAIASLKHPHIAKIYEIGREEQSHFIVMEEIFGDDLRTLFAAKPKMPIEEKLSVIIQVAEGLKHAHENGILHRNLEPGKIHLTSAGVRIRDFGIAGVLMKRLPRPVVRWGSPIYLSPEQIRHQRETVQSDIFSAGIIFYELLTYSHPFHDPDGNKALDNILLNSRIATYERFPEIPPGLWTIVKNCLAKNPNDRYANVDELLIACKDFTKDLAEDIQLMLGELHGSLAPLKKAVAQPEASDQIVKLLQNIESLLCGRKEADFLTLDQLINDLMVQHPVIQNATDTMQPWEAVVPRTTDIETEEDVPPEKQAVLEANPIAIEQPVSPPPNFIADKSTKPDESDFVSPVPTLAERPERTSGKKDKSGRKPESTASPWFSDSWARPIKKLRQIQNVIALHKFMAPSYRKIAALLALLLIMAAAYIAFAAKTDKSIRNMWDLFTNAFYKTANAAESSADSHPVSERKVMQNSPGPVQPQILSVDKKDKKIIRRPACPAAPPASEEKKENYLARKVSALFLAGKYNEASNVLSVWISEDPNNMRAREMEEKNDEIQRALRAYSSAITENRYTDAIAALAIAEKTNPADSTFAELRQQTEAGKAAAKGSFSGKPVDLPSDAPQHSNIRNFQPGLPE